LVRKLGQKDKASDTGKLKEGKVQFRRNPRQFRHNKLTGQSHILFSSDSVLEQEFKNNFPTEYLNTITSGGMAPHRLYLKNNSRVILLRNLNSTLNLCNGTQLKMVDIKNNVIVAERLIGTSAGERLFIPRIPMTTCDSGLPFTLLRRQYPLRPSYALTINKSQGQTLDKVALYLKDDCFSHGQLYVALSRVKTQGSLKIFAKKNRNQFATKNVVYEEIFCD
jgi:hypothetical protein